MFNECPVCGSHDYIDIRTEELVVCAKCGVAYMPKSILKERDHRHDNGQLLFVVIAVLILAVLGAYYIM